MSTNRGKTGRVGRPLRGAVKRVRSSFTLSPDDLAWLEQEARSRGKSKSELLEQFLSLGRNNIAALNEQAAALVKRYPEVYWDVEAEKISGEQHTRFIIERMLEHGTLRGIKELLTTFTQNKIIDVVIHSRRISKRTAMFWKSYFGISEQVECLKKELQNPLSKRWT